MDTGPDPCCTPAPLPPSTIGTDGALRTAARAWPGPSARAGKTRRRLAALLATACGVAAGGASAQSSERPATSPSPYTVTDLSTLGGATTKAMGINEEGRIVGASQIGSYMHAFLWDDGTMTNLGALGSWGSYAYDVNAAGRVVGGSTVDAAFHNHAFLWESGSGIQDLGTLAGGTGSYAFEINDSGQAVGSACCVPDTYLSHAVLWGSGGTVDLGDLDPLYPAISAAYGINDAGQVVGGSYDASANFHAFLWQTGSMQDLGTLGGDYSSAEAINEDGQVVGVSRLADATPHAFLWDGAMQDLGSLGWAQSIAYDINDGGQVVGALLTGSASHAFVWSNGQMQDLNSLIPPDSGWVLNEARAINNRGRIVGFGTSNSQTRAFLLVPREYRWVNPAGGAWSVSTNWDPQGVPGPGDTAVFALAGQYSVDTTTFAPLAVAEADQLRFEGANTVDFDNLNLNVFTDLRVGEGGIVNIHSGSGSFDHGVLGALPPPAGSPPTACLQVFNSGTTLTGAGRLEIGDEGAGELFVANGGQLTTAEARVGGLLATGTGTAIVGGDGSLWDTGNLAVGYGVTGELTIENGGRVNSNDAYVSWGVLSDDSEVRIEGVGAGTGQASMWALQGGLTVGQTVEGYVLVLDGGDLFVSQNVQVKTGILNADGRRPNGDPSDLDILGSAFVGGPGIGGALFLKDAARGGIGGDLIVGRDGVGIVMLWGAATPGIATQLEVVEPSAGLCAFGREFAGSADLDSLGLLRCQRIELGGRAGTNGRGELKVDGGMVRALDVLQVGEVGGGTGQVNLLSNGLVATNGTYITANGVIAGTGTLDVGFLGLHNEGTLSAGVTVLPPFAEGATKRPVTPPATLTIDGALTLGPTSRLELQVAGSLPGEYGSLAVTGTAVLDGVLVLAFTGGYAPSQGDLFTLLTVSQGVAGSFASVEIQGLEPGFEFDLELSNGVLVLEALNDGVPQALVFSDGFESEDFSNWSIAFP